MPPERKNVPKVPPKVPAKIERSRLENQERAYTAASRRSDRSLEARVESARRASEIHFQRTGRRLRVTQEDVENGDLYEEEDLDAERLYGNGKLPPHILTSDPEYNARLQAFINATLAVRDQMRDSHPYARYLRGGSAYRPPLQSAPFYPAMVPRQDVFGGPSAGQPRSTTASIAQPLPLGQSAVPVRSAWASQASSSSPVTERSPDIVRPEQARRMSMPPRNPGCASDESDEQENETPGTGLSTQTQTPHMQSDFTIREQQIMSAMTARQPFSEAISPIMGNAMGTGMGGSLFTNEIPRNMQQMMYNPPSRAYSDWNFGTRESGADTSASGNDSPSLHVHAALDKPKAQDHVQAQAEAQAQTQDLIQAQVRHQYLMQQRQPHQQQPQQQSHSGRRALDVTLPNMQENYGSHSYSQEDPTYQAHPTKPPESQQTLDNQGSSADGSMQQISNAPEDTPNYDKPDFDDDADGFLFGQWLGNPDSDEEHDYTFTFDIAESRVLG